MEDANRGRRGQSTLEYALVLMAFLATVLAFGALWRAASEGRLLDLAREHASHSLENGISVEFLQDLLAY